MLLVIGEYRWVTGRVAGFTEKKNSIFIFLDQVAVDGLPGVGGTVGGPKHGWSLAGDGNNGLKKRSCFTAVGHWNILMMRVILASLMKTHIMGDLGLCL